MKLPTSSVLPDKLESLLKRPASIVIRFNNDTRYREAVNFYHLLLGLPGAPGSAGTLEEFYSLEVGLGADIELRLVRRGKGGQRANHTVVYWAVNSQNLPEAHRTILDRYPRQYREIDAPSPDPALPDKPNQPKPSTARSIIEDDAGNQIGLLVNPPYPHGLTASAYKYLLPLAGLVAGLLLGPTLAGLFYKSRR